MSRHLRILLGSAVLGLAPWTTGCGDGETPLAAARPTTVLITPATARLSVLGATVQLTAEVLDQHGQAMNVPVAWSSGSAEVATVSESGLVTAVANGAAAITAAAGEAQGAAAITVLVDPERAALVALYEATDGPNWANSDRWLSDSPLGDWYGVSTDDAGRVVAIDLGPLWDTETSSSISQGLRGEIPPEIGDLTALTTLDLSSNYLSGSIPPEIGTLTSLTRLDLGTNSLSGIIPPAIGNLANLIQFDAGANLLVGRIPAEIGSIANLTMAALQDNMLFGEIPAEIGNLASLTWLDLSGNRFTGIVPHEIGGLDVLTWLDLSANALTGPVPATIGNLTSLTWLNLSGNRLTGAVPHEIGDLSGLTWLDLSANALTGPVPAAVGNLLNLTGLVLASNELSGPIPPGIGNLDSLRTLDLSANELAGPVPVELAALTSLRAMVLENNSELEGVLPTELINLGQLEYLQVQGTKLCAPRHPGFRAWLEGLTRPWIRSCGDGPPVYLVQAVQSREYPVPLVAGDSALLRVFLTAAEATSENIPEIRARFYLDGIEKHVVSIPEGSVPIPVEVDEGNLGNSANAVIDGALVRPGLEMVIEVDPDGTLDPALGVPQRIPESGRLALDVRAMPRLDLTLIPFVWTATHDSTIVDLTGAMAANPERHEMLGPTRTLLPVGELEVTAHAPVLTSSNNASALLGQTSAIRAMEGGTGHYQGMMVPPVTGSSGVAYRPGRSSFAQPRDYIMAHELGHNMNLSHAPCGDPVRTDPYYPYPDGSIGAWGYDFADGGKLVPPPTTDLLSYCPPHWISDYHFSQALVFRVSDADSAGLPDRTPATAALFLWGGADADGKPFLEPAFVVDAPPSLPESPGRYRLAAHASDGVELFLLSFNMPDIADGDGGSSFAFVVPVGSAWAAELASISLVGPGGSVTLDRDSDLDVAILRDPGTGQVRGILRDGSELTWTWAEAAAHSPDQGLEVLFSRGIPGAGAWRR